jgi:hypothetical protein
MFFLVLIQKSLFIQPRRRLSWWLLAIVFVVGFVLLAHGCHGDADHEL